MKNDLIKELNLSTRTYNALMRTNITTIDDLLKLPTEQIFLIKNMGAKSIKEVQEKIADIQMIDELNSHGMEQRNHVKSFIGSDGIVYIDTPVSELELSKRSNNCLEKNGIQYYSQLVGKKEEELFEIDKMGAKSVYEILDKISTYKLVPAGKDSIDETEEDRFCRKLLQEILCKLVINTNQVYPLLQKLVIDILEKEKCILNDEIFQFLTPCLYEQSTITEAIIGLVIKTLELSQSGVDEAKLIELLPMCLTDKRLFHELLIQMVEQRYIFINDEQLYERRYPTIMEYISKLDNERASQILELRLGGKTLEEVGKEFGITRERIRQIESKYIKKSPQLMEDRYSYVFEMYDISKKDFLLGFREKEEAYNYLIVAYEKGIKNIEYMLEDDNLSNQYKICAERIIYKNYVILNGERVLRSRPELSEYILRTVGKEGITFEDFSELYRMLLEDLNLQEDSKFTLMERGYENKLSVSDHILWKHHKKLRYYNINAYDFTNLFSGLNLKQYENIEISTLKLFREFPDLMEEYDIQDEYELHNLLKKICSKDIFPTMKFNRMPNIEFGEADRDGQVMNLLLELAPVTNIELAEMYEREYGVLSRTVLANYLKSFDKYFFDGVYKIDAPRMSELMLSSLRQQMSKEFYLFADIRKIYKDAFPNADSQLLNPLSVKALGFRVYSNYVIKNNYISAVDYFRTILTKEDLVDSTIFPDGLQTLLAYMNEVYRLKLCYEIIEYKPAKYVNIRRLNSVGVNQDDIKDYCKKVYQHNTPTYFTVYSLTKNGFEHPLEDLGFDEWFYSSILVEDKTHFSHRRMGGSRLFKKGRGTVCLVDFIEWILYSIDTLSMDIYDFTDNLSNEYNINLSVFKIMETISGSSMYYDKITEKIYADYEVYFAEI
ncbi:DNA-directed RNA polymerase subunit alpha C-terminal domain-containing protein [Anaerocolumna sp. AGMB13020]|uniref:DNA-directed RNA polymerase subunit alpha C-terminal domain-containing protein n=1 Tax=Anaerocolumna sp. AGMB13020 TaxID=3081750 RepID=UPI002F3EDDD4